MNLSWPITCLRSKAYRARYGAESPTEQHEFSGTAFLRLQATTSVQRYCTGCVTPGPAAGNVTSPVESKRLANEQARVHQVGPADGNRPWSRSPGRSARGYLEHLPQ